MNIDFSTLKNYILALPAGMVTFTFWWWATSNPTLFSGVVAFMFGVSVTSIILLIIAMAEARDRRLHPNRWR
jgi:hypothetical protein